MPLAFSTPVWSGQATVACEATTSHTAGCPLLFLTTFAHFTEHWSRLASLAELRDKGLCCPAGTEAPCTFEGKVDADDDNHALHFECPRCGTAQEQET